MALTTLVDVSWFRTNEHACYVHTWSLSPHTATSPTCELLPFAAAILACMSKPEGGSRLLYTYEKEAKIRERYLAVRS